ncbi:MlaD family protein [Roseateles sp.]|jgi:paraquat-inducible protein B|uniref:MlaD family protein n=1 Tax=Roseateles sp. TaxID=1971397 RepID=UPI0037C615B6
MSAPARRRKGNPALLGLFVVGALVLLFLAVVLLAGGQLWTRKQVVVMHFGGSIYGLQVGAPVVFRGVRLGSVSEIGLAYDKSGDRVLIPVRAELERQMLRNVVGEGADSDLAEAIPALVQRGLRAQLATQSLLTGQLYIDLDFHPEKRSLRVDAGLANEVPTISTAFQELRSQVEELDIKRLVADISAIAGSTRALLANPELHQTLRDVAQATAQMRGLMDKLNRQADPVLNSAQGAAEATRVAMLDVSRAAARVDETFKRIDTATEGVAATMAPDAPLVMSLRRSADELAATAVALRGMTAEDAPLSQNLQRSLQDMARAARALRELSETLDQQPESMLKGRR